MTRHPNAKKKKSLFCEEDGGGREGKQNSHVFTFWLLLAFLTLPFSVHVVVCVQSNGQSGLGPCGCLPKRLAQTIQEASTYLQGMGRRIQQTSQELCRISHEKYWNKGHLCSIINQKEWKQSLRRRGQTCGELGAKRPGESVRSRGCLEFTLTGGLLICVFSWWWHARGCVDVLISSRVQMSNWLYSQYHFPFFLPQNSQKVNYSCISNIM